MATFITTMHFTEQGIKAVRDTCGRADAFKSAAKKMGVKVSTSQHRLYSAPSLGVSQVV